jgi:hypothetical protein
MPREDEGEVKHVVAEIARQRIESQDIPSAR